MVKKEANSNQEPITGLKVRELIGISQAVDMVGDLKFPMKIGYQLSKTKNQLETSVKAYDKRINELRETLRVKKDDNWIIPDKNLKQWRKESEGIAEQVDNDLKLRTFKFTDFDFAEDEHYGDTQVPQAFITLMYPLLTE